MITSTLYEIVRQYLESEITIEKLEDWYVPRLKTLLADPNSDQARFVGEIELGLVDVQSNQISEAQFKNRLLIKLSPTVWIECPQDVNISSGSSSSSFKKYEYQFLYDQPILVTVR